VRLGDYEIRVISGGRFRLDGGGMFGVVPKPLWEREHPADARNRIALDTNCLLVCGGDEVVLIDTGNGSKLSPKEREIFDLAPGDPLLANLAAAGIAPEAVTAVVFSHLHLDHCGGASVGTADAPVVAFPRARYFVQRQEWEDALANRSHMRTSYRRENLAPLAESGRLVLLDGAASIFPHVRVEPTPGHTRGHQSVIVSTSAAMLVYLGDLCPTRSHLRPPYNMAYDLDPYGNMLQKEAMLARVEREGGWVVFDHDPAVALARIERGEDGRYVALPIGDE